MQNWRNRSPMIESNWCQMSEFKKGCFYLYYMCRIYKRLLYEGSSYKMYNNCWSINILLSRFLLTIESWLFNPLVSTMWLIVILRSQSWSWLRVFLFLFFIQHLRSQPAFPHSPILLCYMSKKTNGRKPFLHLNLLWNRNFYTVYVYSITL